MSGMSDHVPAYMPGWRRFKDKLATVVISAGAAWTLIAILLIFFYLILEVLPLFDSAEVSPAHRAGPLAIDAAGVKYLAVEEHGELGLLVSADGAAHFFDTASGLLRRRIVLAADTAAITTVVAESPQSGLLGVGYTDGRVRVVRHSYDLSYPDDERLISPRIDFPYGEQGTRLFGAHSAVRLLTLRDAQDSMTLAAQADSGELAVRRIIREQHFLGGETRLLTQKVQVPDPGEALALLLLDSDQRWLYQLHHDGRYVIWDLQGLETGAQTEVVAREVDAGRLFDDGVGLASASMLLGGISLLAASDDGGTGAVLYAARYWP